MKKALLSLLGFWTFQNAYSQIAANYEVGAWKDFKTAAVSYTFDDNCSNQIPVAIPLFDNSPTFASIVPTKYGGCGT